MAFYWLAQKTSYYVNEVAPGEEAAHKILNGVNTSTQLLNEWIHTHNPDSRIKRQLAWEKIVYPGFNRLSNIKGVDKNLLKQLEQDLHAYENEQWIIEDLVHVPGNKIAENQYLTRIAPIKETMFSTISGFISNLRTPEKSHASKTLYALPMAADVRGYFTYADAKMLSYIQSERTSEIAEFRHAFTKTRKRLTELRQLDVAYTSIEKNQLVEAVRLLSLYNSLAEYVFQLHQKPEWNLASYRINHNLTPLSHNLSLDLDTIVAGQHQLAALHKKQLVNYEYYVLIFMVAALLVLVFLAVMTSRSKAIQLTRPLAQLDDAVRNLVTTGETASVSVQGYAEVVSLTDTFNTISIQLNENKQALLESMRKLEVANNAKSVFLSSMSHEFRTPLNAIMGFNQLIGLEIAQGDTKNLETYQIEVDKATRLLIHLVDSMLEMVTIDDLVLDKSRLVIAEIIESVITRYAEQARQREIKLEYTTREKECGYVITDKFSLQKIISYLVDNAIKYNIQGGEVKVQCDSSQSGLIRVCVADTGPGLSDNDIEHLFDPFNRLGHESIGGTGL
ncbi:MAG: HAMP domain-containing sensor histidine kinase, partial [Thioalkalispiraceae bacterium]